MQRDWSKKDTLVALAGLQVLYPKNLGPDRMNAYVTHLYDIAPNTLLAAVQSLAHTKTFLPSIAEIREAARDIQHLADGEDDGEWFTAWYEVRRAVAKVGRAGHPVFTDPVLTDVIHYFGWYNLCTMPAADESIIKAQFRQVYTSIKEKKRMKEEYRTAVRQLADEAQQGKYQRFGDQLIKLAQKMGMEEVSEHDKVQRLATRHPGTSPD